MELGKIYIKFMKRGNIYIICNVISRLVEKKKNFKKGWRIIYYGMELVIIRKEMKYVLLKMFVFYQQYLWALTKFLEILYV